jgi:hypothetical protein
MTRSERAWSSLVMPWGTGIRDFFFYERDRRLDSVARWVWGHAAVRALLLSALTRRLLHFHCILIVGQFWLFVLPFRWSKVLTPIGHLPLFFDVISSALFLMWVNSCFLSVAFVDQRCLTYRRLEIVARLLWEHLLACFYPRSFVPFTAFDLLVWGGCESQNTFYFWTKKKENKVQTNHYAEEEIAEARRRLPNKIMKRN